jgi:hypothetical protein
VLRYSDCCEKARVNFVDSPRLLAWSAQFDPNVSRYIADLKKTRKMITTKRLAA